MKKHKFITYMNYKSNHGFWVRIGEVEKRTKHQKLFPVLRHGGKRKAQNAAIKWRNEILKKHYNGRIDFQYDNKRARIKPRTDSNILGVNYSNRLRSDHGVWEERWGAQCSRNIKGKTFHKHRSFSVNLYGYHGAYKLACKARKELEKHFDDLQVKMRDVEEYV